MYSLYTSSLTRQIIIIVIIQYVGQATIAMLCRYTYCAHLNTNNVMMVTVRPNRERVVPIIESVARAT